jgi:ABC-2 type transport system permease protein
VLRRIWHIVVKEFIQFIRDRLLIVFLFTFPVMQLVLVAQATGSGVSDLPTAVLDGDRSQTSRGLARALDNTEELKLCCFPGTVAEVEWLLDDGSAGLALIIPPNFERDLLDARAATVPTLQLLADGSNSIAGGTALRTAEGAIQSYLAPLHSRRTQVQGLAAAGQPGPLDVRVSIRFNPSLDTRKYAIPAQFAFIVYQVTLIVAALGLARERELGTLEQLSVTPLRRFELLTGKAIPAAAIGFVDFIIMLVVVVRIYDIPMLGSWPLLFLLSALFIAAETSWGLMLSAFSRTQQQAVLFIFLLAVTEIMLSGYMVPVQRLPLGLQAISLFSPIRHYMVILRAIMLKGAGLAALWRETLALLVLGIGVAVFATRSVMRSID